MSSLRFPEILIRFTWCWNVTGDLRTIVMNPDQRFSEGDTAAGNLCTKIVCIIKRLGNCYGVDWAVIAAAKSRACDYDRGDNCRFSVYTVIYCNGLTGAKAFYTGNGDNCCPNVGGSNYRGSPCCANSRDYSSLAIYA